MKRKVSYTWARAEIILRRHRDKQWRWRLEYFGTRWENGRGVQVQEIKAESFGSRTNKKVAMREAKDFSKTLNLPCTIKEAF